MTHGRWKPRFRRRVKSCVISALHAGDWHENFRRIGNGLFIAGIATPALSGKGSFITMIGIVLMIVAKTQTQET